eukprot:4561490-Amphidinium_carterae.1
MLLSTRSAMTCVTMACSRVCAGFSACNRTTRDLWLDPGFEQTVQSRCCALLRHLSCNCLLKLVDKRLRSRTSKPRNNKPEYETH